MSLRPGRCYRDVDKHAYTRTAKKAVTAAFIKGVPNPKIVHFDMGNPNEDYETEILFIVEDAVQMRHNALESARIFVNKILSEKIGSNNYHFKIRVYPHHVLRENAMVTGAGADRVQSGMRHSFGKKIGKAARLDRGQTLMSVRTTGEKNINAAIKAFKQVNPKLPGKCSIEVRSLKKDETAKQRDSEPAEAIQENPDTAARGAEAPGNESG
jgi:large subunit ribosomal protein L10e